MSYELLSESRPKARKDHRCIWCGQKIEKGTTYISERSVFDGEMQNHHWHVECSEASQEYFSQGECEFDPYSNERPLPGTGEKHGNIGK